MAEDLLSLLTPNAVEENFDPVDWLEENIRVSSDVSPNMPGLVSFQKQPWARQILQDFLNPAIEVICIKSGAQTGKSFIMMMGYCLLAQFAPSSCIIGLPNQDLANRWAKTRLLPILQNNKIFSDRLPVSSWSRLKSMIRLTGMPTLYTSLMSPANLSSVPCEYVIVDEAAKIKSNNKAEAHPLHLIRERQKSFAHSKFICASTPAVRDEPFYSNYFLQGSRERWVNPCPHCGKEFEWRFSKNCLYWPEDCGKDLGAIMQSAKYVCPHCKGLIDNSQRIAAIKQGHWQSENPNAPANHKSYDINGFLSPFVTLGDIAAEYQKALTSVNKTDSLKNFYNSTLGKIYNEKELNEEMGIEDVKRCVSYEYKKSEIPEDTALLCVGGDAGTFKSHWVEAAICFDGTIKVLNWGTILSHSTDIRRNKQGYASLLHELEGTGHHIDVTFLDYGFDSETIINECLLAQSWGFGAWPCKGIGNSSGGTWTSARLNNYNNLDLYKFNDYSLKSNLIRGLKEGKITFAQEAIEDKDFLLQFTGQQIKTNGYGRPSFAKVANDHYLDCLKLIVLIQFVNHLQLFAEQNADYEPKLIKN